MDIYKIITIKEGTECKHTKTNSPRNDSSSGDHLNISINGAAATTTVVAMAVAVADVRQSTTATHLISCDSMNSLEIVSI